MNSSEISKTYDIVIAGGGITGAGVFHEAVKRGYSALLAESEDFTWGTSGRSSKMVHGGLRYLSQGKFLLTKASVKEREFLLNQYPGLITPLNFIMPIFNNYGTSESAMKLGLCLYSFMAGEKQHQFYTKQEALSLIPWLRKENLVSATGFRDAQVDDARLVLRLIYDACQNGGMAVNYTGVTGFERDRQSRLSVVFLKDKISDREFEIKTRVLINCTGAFAEHLHPSHKHGLHIRPLRGSHLFFPFNRFPLDKVISFIHPHDLRPIFIFPWEGILALGTTDVDHRENLHMEPRMTKQEADYLMEGLHHVLPDCPLAFSDCIGSMAGVRPVLTRKKAATASKESREHVVWKDNGLITVTGGKLTTFRLLAYDALKAAKAYLPEKKTESGNPLIFHNTINKDSFSGIAQELVHRIYGRYGFKAGSIILDQDKALLTSIENTPNIWSELCYAAKYENVHHLSDLMLRRLRIGLLLPNGGIYLLDKIQKLCQPFLSWDDERWQKEKKEYALLWNSSYSPPLK